VLWAGISERPLGHPFSGGYQNTNPVEIVRFRVTARRLFFLLSRVNGKELSGSCKSESVFATGRQCNLPCLLPRSRLQRLVCVCTLLQVKVVCGIVEGGLAIA